MRHGQFLFPKVNEIAFRGTGPQGHRARMRARILVNGAETLADYEVLEMLLFFGIPRRDTKPLAKGLIQHFGSLFEVFRAQGKELHAFGLSDAAIRALRLPAIAAERLAGAEARVRPMLGNWAQLLAYVEIAILGAKPGQLRILYLDNRNRLLADEPIETDAITAPIFCRALSLHATALIGLELAETDMLKNAKRRARLAKQIEQEAQYLAITLHDVMIMGEGTPISLRQEGLL
ncbi:JAB domain-containing protein [Kozakia baliensis]|uniref:JAB domain-containing protein n=1 Tax=Kozakia baliensis TaxID=153496 RepID=UPI000B10140C|nr:JAB domain-containing protein [Kozakia baliensis]GEL63990.1 UPF0758 protein R01728 [Kozakia baliensis]